MAERLFSDHWYRVEHLRPRLRAHVRLHRHEYRDAIWYVLFDPVNARSSRFSQATNFLVSRLDGTHSVGEIWAAACDRLGDDAPTQDEFIRLLSQLHSSDLLISGAPTDTEELGRRRKKQKRAELRQKVWSPLSLKIPLLDPDDFVTRTLPFVAPFLGWLGVAIWLAVCLGGLTLALLNWEALTANLADRVLTGSNILIAVLVYPVVKAVHELAHAYMIKKWGGDVHEMGVMMIVFMPVPYVDASSAITMRRKRRRMLVSAMGVFAELFLAALAMIIWAWAEPGLTRAVAWNVMLICGVSTVLFNGNPLLRFDGYYVLADWLEIPNLATRANKYIGYLIQKYGFGMKEAEDPVTAPGEREWFAFYAVASFLYRMFIMFGIVLFVATKFFFIGVLLAIWAVFTQLVVPMAKLSRFVVADPRVGRQRRRALWVSGLGLGALALAALVVPLPYATIADGVIRAPDEAIVRAASAGEATEILAASQDRVVAGQPILRTEDPLLEARAAVLRTQLAEYDARLAMVLAEDARRADVLREQIAATQADLDDAEEALADLTIRAPADGLLVLARGDDLLGTMLSQGEVAAYVLDADRLSARVAVPEARIGLVRDRREGVAVWPAGPADTDPIPARFEREIPGGTRQLSSPALGTRGGGAIPVDPGDPNGQRALAQVFEIDVAFANPDPQVLVGRRVHVRFDHGTAPLAGQVWYALRQLFLDRFEL
ncbi:HlyD family efflux transporter periplasmic adaptor subunit [Jannaschia seohaensis]|uniref:Putative peptide zinc metalloprotease protein n=1 Tax=Jannaschia seohaensis TaxID=475081 RepID=A0A2Y9AJM2_9RHOB|nr:HlyD family efflux transporter periplasmic adaptor subunit [Jannaschia seohaensis]PWJ20242.1 putative peptide zinc metalloprotease protein [Jannaschia seohaensis]SSA44246.1 putative peptide zinc metalloprotease protein [Jannaschia seohaensis]